MNGSVILNLLATVGITTGTQLISLLGAFFILGGIMSWLQKQTNSHYSQSLGWSSLLWTAWLGTPIHECSHWLFAKIFHHRIISVSLFAPNPQTGGLGNVTSSFQSSSIYQRMGNFFIGAGPLIFGPLVLAILAYFFLPDGPNLFRTSSEVDGPVLVLLNTIALAFDALLNAVDFTRWEFWLFFYVSLAISSHIAPSRQDLRLVWRGFGWLVAILFCINLIAALLNLDFTSYLRIVQSYSGILVAMLSYALLLSLLHFIATLPLRLIRR